MPYEHKYTTAKAALAGFFAALLDAVAPPRQTERLVRGLTAARLQELLPEGETSLPYRDETVRALVWELKYRGSARAAELGGVFLAEQLLSVATEELGRPLLLPVPMHASRRAERGYNQTEILCEAALKALSSYDYVPNVLTRTRATPPQQGLPKHERLKNLRGSMQADARVRGRACVVVDDVTTTGATFAEAKRALRQAGARAVHCVALARS